MSRTALVVEDEGIFREFICNFLKSNYRSITVFEAGDGVTAWETAKKVSPDFCIVDLKLPLLSGVDLIELLLNSHLTPRLLVLTANKGLCDSIEYKDKTDVFIIEKMTSLHELRNSLTALFNPGHPLEETFRLSKRTPIEKTFGLTSREQMILTQIGYGAKTGKIAEVLGISVHTVRTHRRNIMRKLQVHSNSELVRFSIQNHLPK